MNGAKAFFDTNVLLYIHGPDARKRARAKALYQEYALSGRMLVSTQVVQEFFAAGSRKMGIPRVELREAVGTLLEGPLVIVGPAHIRAAMDNEQRHGISFWDGLIVAAAEDGKAEVLYTEDLNDGQQYGTVLVRNPFRD